MTDAADPGKIVAAGVIVAQDPGKIVAAGVLDAAIDTTCVATRVSQVVFWKDFTIYGGFTDFWMDLELKYRITVGQDPIEKAVVNIGWELFWTKC